MSLLQTIKSDALEARKAGNRVAAGVLITLLSEAEMVGKNAGNRETTDAEVTAVVKKFIKNINETLNSSGLSADRRSAFEAERELLNRYVPAELGEAELRLAIAEIGTGLTVRDTGRVMGALNTKYPGQINGKMVSDILKASA